MSYKQKIQITHIDDEKVERLLYSLCGMIESYEMLIAKDSPLNDLARGVVAGFFVTEITRAKKLLMENMENT